MGVVYLGVHAKTGRQTAIKMLLPECVAHEEAMRLFLRETSLLMQLKHPRIVECFGMGKSGDQLYFLMEYLPVEDNNLLRIVAKQSRPKQIRLACSIASCVLEALEYAHDQGIVHRDIKPANILAYKIDKRLHIKLGDFGLAKRYVDAGFSSLSLHAGFRGSLLYSAPECVRNSRFANPASDIYSVGVCLYQMLSGSLPYDFKPTDAVGIVYAGILNNPPIPLVARVQDVPSDLVAIVARALATQPEDRFASAAEMRKALQQTQR
jgi:serine/threonine-protein kinase